MQELTVIGYPKGTVSESPIVVTTPDPGEHHDGSNLHVSPGFLMARIQSHAS